jgi:hypothetical protein
VDEKPQKLIARLLEFAAMFALSMYLIKLGVCYLSEVWWILLILAALAVGGYAVYRLWRNRGTW